MDAGKADSLGDQAVIEKDKNRDDQTQINDLSDTENTEQDDNTCHGDEHGRKTVRIEGKKDKIDPDHDSYEPGPAPVIPGFLKIDEPSCCHGKEDKFFDIDTPSVELAGKKHGYGVQGQYSEYGTFQFFV